MSCQELHRLKALIDEIIVTGVTNTPAAQGLYQSFQKSIQASVLELREGLESVYFSNAAAPELQRYFNYHLGVITALGYKADEAKLATVNIAGEEVYLASLDFILQELTVLTDHILRLFLQPPDNNLQSFPSYYKFFIGRLSARLDGLKIHLDESDLNAQLKDPLLRLFKSFDGYVSFSYQTYHALHYLDFLTASLTRVRAYDECEQERFVIDELIRCNFNDLGFLAFLQETIRQDASLLSSVERHDFLKKRIAICQLNLKENLFIYDPQWPTINQMLCNWLQEESRQAAEVRDPSCEAEKNDKLLLNLPVAHIACFLRAFCDNNVSRESLSSIFRHIAAHYRTRRQSNISAGSLGKEYYTVTQFTAARVREQLHGMIAAINRFYFPVMVAISAACYFSGGNGLVLPAIGN